MIKRILLIIILIVLMGAIILSISYHAPTAVSLTTVTETEESEYGKTVTITTYVNKKGRATVASDKGYASDRTTRDEEDQKVLEEYLDENGQRILLSSGYAAISYAYTDGLATTINYLDEELSPVVIASGYDSIHRTYNEKGLADTDTYFAVGQPVMRTQGYAAYKRIYNDKKQAIMLEYRGLDGELVLTNTGYARRIRSFNEAGKIECERYYDTSGSPAILALGQSGYTRRYDDQGRTTETVYIGADGAPINTKRGYAIIRMEYLPDGSTKTLYYDKDGKPVTGGNSQYGVLNTGDQKIYLDEDGDVMKRLDNILFTHPYLVLILGTVMTVAAVFVKGKMRWVLLIVYFLFVLYMTMYYRVPRGSRKRLELFYSYRRMFSDDNLRQQVVNNILLFIPLGTILSNLFMDRMGTGKSVLISVLICMIFSMAIEAVQWEFGIGLAEADDVISNTAGGLIGAGIAGQLMSNRRKEKARGDDFAIS